VLRNIGGAASIIIINTRFGNTAIHLLNKFGLQKFYSIGDLLGCLGVKQKMQKKNNLYFEILLNKLFKDLPTLCDQEYTLVLCGYVLFITDRIKSICKICVKFKILYIANRLKFYSTCKKRASIKRKILKTLLNK